MIRNGQPQSNEVLVDVSQHTAESARLSVEQQLKNLEDERQILADRKRELERMLCTWKIGTDCGRHNVPSHKTRQSILEELHELQNRTQIIKPTMAKLRERLNINDKADIGGILMEILTVLKRIEKQ